MFHLQPNRNFQNLLVNGKRPMSVIDIFSRFLFLRPLQSKEISDVAEHEALCRHVCLGRNFKGNSKSVYEGVVRSIVV